MVSIAVLGYGIVGSGVVEVLNANQASIDKRAGIHIRIKYVLDKRRFPGNPVEDILTDDIETILQDPEVKVIAEVMGGVEPAYSWVKKALLCGKSVVSSNKELVAQHGAELLSIAKQMNTNFLFEASVGGGIPIIRPLNESLTADEIYEITGILNGTTNFILTKMTQEGREFEDVLKEAQALGYAERNPSADVEGHDACRKIAILSSLAFGMQVDYEDIYTEGITAISKLDIAYAKKMSCQIKLLATSQKEDQRIFARVSPTMIGSDHPLSTVQGVFNAVLVKGNMIGDVMFYGRGAGKLPTASAVVADIIDAVRHLNQNKICFWSTEKIQMMDLKDAPTRFFVRVAYEDFEGAIKEVENIFGVLEVVRLEEASKEFAIITELETEGLLQEKIEELQQRNGIKIVNRIRIEK